MNIEHCMHTFWSRIAIFEAHVVYAKKNWSDQSMNFFKSLNLNSIHEEEKKWRNW